MDIRRIDVDRFATALGRAEGKIFEQPFEYRMEPARTDILRPRVDRRGDFGKRRHRIFGKVQTDFFGFQQRNVLLGEGVFGFGQDDSI